MRILIVEDEIRLADTLGAILSSQKYAYDIVYDGADGVAYGESDIYDVIILDIMLPKLNGFDVVKALRSKKIQTPVLLLTARDDVSDKVRGLDCGADDYLTKPFSSQELLARVRALSRRQGEVVINEVKYLDLALNLSKYELQCGDKAVHLSHKEAEIMRLFITSPGTLFRKEDFLVKVWGYETEAEDNNVEVYISFLRKKLQFLGTKVVISTVRKLGYFIEQSK